MTGAQGFLGRFTVSALLAAGVEAVLGVGRSARNDAVYTHELDWLGRRAPAPVPKSLRDDFLDDRYTYAQLDVTSVEDVADMAAGFEPDAVIHCAASLHDRAWSDLVKSNIEGTYGLLQGLARAVNPRIVLASSGSVYGNGRGELPFVEDGPLEPIDLYAVSKRSAEEVARVVASQHGLSISQARIFNLIGPGLQDCHLPAVLAARLAEIVRGLADPQLRVGRTEATRDFVDARDAASALVLLMRAPSPTFVNVASGHETRIGELLEMFVASSGVVDVPIERVDGRPAGVSRAWASVRRLRDLGHVPRYPLIDTVNDMLGYFDDFPSAQSDG